MAKINGGIIGPNNPTGPFSAGGVWRVEDAFNAQKAGTWPLVLGYQIPNSCRFNRGSSDQLTRTLASTGDQQKSTWSCWIKKCNFTNEQIFFGYSTAEFAIYTNADSFRISNSDAVIFLYSTALQRDPSAWYHFVVAIDTTQATASNRIRMYVNGTELTSFTNTGYPTQNTNLKMNVSGKTMAIGSDGTSAFDGYMSEHYWIDGQQLTPSSFGQTDSATGIWTPKAYAGTYGTNGFYLNFANSADLGNDVSGNNNDFTANNLTSIDQSYDSPTNNFATFNSIKFAGGDLTQGNLELDSTSGSWKTRNSTIGVSAGKWFMEFKMGTITDDQSGVAIVPDTVPDGNFPASDATRSPAIGYNSEGKKWVNGTGTASYFATMTSNDIIGIALDMDNGTVQFYRNGSTTGSPINLSDAFTSSNYPLFFVAAVYGTRDVQANFGYPPFTISSGNADANGFGNFEYAVPSGYYSLCTKNLALYG